MNSEIIERLLRRALKKDKHPWGLGEPHSKYDEMDGEQMLLLLGKILALREIEKEAQKIATEKQKAEAVPNDYGVIDDDDRKFHRCSTGGRVVRSTRGMS